MKKRPDIFAQYASEMYKCVIEAQKFKAKKDIKLGK